MALGAAVPRGAGLQQRMGGGNGEITSNHPCRVAFGNDNAVDAVICGRHCLQRVNERPTEDEDRPVGADWS